MLVRQRLEQFSAVALLGPRQVGKTTLALQLGQAQPSVYLDLESAADHARLAEPVLFMKRHADKLVILFIGTHADYDRIDASTI